MRPFYFQEAPGRRLAAVRVLVFGFALGWLVGYAKVVLSVLAFPAHRFAPIGVVSLLEAPLPKPLGLAIWGVAVIASAAALLGAFYRVAAPVSTLALLWVATYRSSWGMIFHTENLLVMHALVLAVAPAADAWSIDAWRDPSRRARGDEVHARYGVGLRLMAMITVTAYVLAGIAKLRAAGGVWLDGDVLLSHVAWDNLRKLELGDLHSPIGAFFCRTPEVFGPLAWTSLLLELGAPLALLGPRLGRLWSFGIWAFHLGVLVLMAIAFVYPLTGIAFAPFLAPERWVDRLRGQSRRN